MPRTEMRHDSYRRADDWQLAPLFKEGGLRAPRSSYIDFARNQSKQADCASNQSTNADTLIYAIAPARVGLALK